MTAVVAAIVAGCSIANLKAAAPPVEYDGRYDLKTGGVWRGFGRRLPSEHDCNSLNQNVFGIIFSSIRHICGDMLGERTTRA
jgi:hypothetical protein